ncbi:MAG: S-layer homology domain-containing protein, partial [Clostridia bacterium]|nr:S-layer homology domain-containing protein [Clostridia bacterium]
EDVKEVFDAALLAAQEYDEKEDDDEGSFSGGGGGAGGGGGSSKDSRIPIAKVEKAAESTMFKDVSHVSWAKEAIETFAKNGIVSGTGNNNFSPDANVTREQFVKMLLGTFGISANNVESVTDFSDVDKNAWYYKYVHTAVSMGLASGYGDSFGVGDFITREDMSVMIYKAAALKKVAINAISENAPSDYAEISAYAQESVDALYKAGIINGVGDGKFAPKAKATRAQAVKLLYELWRVAK